MNLGPDAAGEHVLIRWKPLGGKLVSRCVAFERRVASPRLASFFRSRLREQDGFVATRRPPQRLSFFLYVIRSSSSATVVTKFLPPKNRGSEARRNYLKRLMLRRLPKLISFNSV